MKKRLIIGIILVISTMINAQSTYEKEMQQAIKVLSKTEELQKLRKIANKFEQISSIEKKKWLPRYYVAYTYTAMTRIGEGDTKSKDLLLEKAQNFLNQSALLSTKNEEIIILQGYIDQSKFFVSPSNRLQSFKKTSKTIKDALKLYPNNPRANLIHGIQIFHKPAFLGGGAKKAKPYFETAQKLFNVKSNNTLHPNWGKDINAYYLKECE